MSLGNREDETGDEAEPEELPDPESPVDLRAMGMAIFIVSDCDRLSMQRTVA